MGILDRDWYRNRDRLHSSGSSHGSGRDARAGGSNGIPQSRLVSKASLSHRNRTLRPRSVLVFATTLIVLTAIVTLAIDWGYHWAFAGADSGQAARMVVQDLRLAQECPSSYELVKEFVQRPATAGSAIQAAEALGLRDWPAAVCATGVFLGY